MEDIIKFLKKNWYYVAAVVLLIVVVVVIRRRNKKEKELAEKGLFSGTSGVGDGGMPDAKYPLRPYEMVSGYSAEKGSYGYQIKYLQNLINEADAYTEKLPEDGKYGPKTLAAFKAVYANNIASNGQINETQYDEIVKKYYIK